MISPLWLPLFGGGEQYEYRLAVELINRGHDVEVICGTDKDDNKFNGIVDAHRFTQNGQMQWASWSDVFTTEDKSLYNKKRSDLFRQFHFFDDAYDFAKKFSPDIVIIGNSLQSGSTFHAREFYARLKTLGCKVGLIHHDISDELTNILKDTYINSHHDWDKSSKIVKQSLLDISKNYLKTEFNWVFGSPVFYEPDFIISNTDWSASLIDLLNMTKHFTLHPILDVNNWKNFNSQNNELEMVDILMINPQARKNPLAMAELIDYAPQNMTFRVLKGGWGDSFHLFKQLVSETNTFKDGRIHFVDYISDIRDAYVKTKMVFFPSLVEGYGLAAVEPMFLGTPVLSSNYPAILEAVGSGASVLCPYQSTGREWLTSAISLLDNHEYWASKAKERSEELGIRQEKELSDLEVFFDKVCS
jgi:glycosyltransferase involved in cell wall biosynthesis